MAVCESTTFISKSVDIGSRDGGPACAAQVSISQIIDINQDDVGLFSSRQDVAQDQTQQRLYQTY